MNSLRGKISEVKGDHALSLVRIEVNGITMSSVVLDPPDSPHLQPGQEVNVLFKETEVVLGLPGDHAISLQNRIPCTVADISAGGLLARVKMQYNEHMIESIVTARAVQQLGIRKGSQVMAMIKTNEVLLQV